MDCFVAEPVMGPAERPDPLAPRNDDKIHIRLLAARCVRVVHEPFALEKSEGAGKAGCPQPRVQRVESTRVRHHRSTGTPGLPCTMVLTVSFALSPVIGLCCHRRRWSRLHQLDASVEASGPHDFAVRKPAPSSRAQPASTAFLPASVTIAIRPSIGSERKR
jgi:hypothetical protein